MLDVRNHSTKLEDVRIHCKIYDGLYSFTSMSECGGLVIKQMQAFRTLGKAHKNILPIFQPCHYFTTPKSARQVGRPYIKPIQSYLTSKIML